MSEQKPPGEILQVSTPEQDDELRAAFARQGEQDAAGQFYLSLLDIWGTTVAALVGRGLLEGDNLRRDLLGHAKMWREQGNVVRAIPIEHVARNLAAMIEAVERAKHQPPVAGSA